MTVSQHEQKGVSMDAGNGARQVVECRVCGGCDWQDVVSFGPVPLADSFLDPAESYDDEPYYPLGVISCRSCRLMSLTHVVDPETLYRTYPYVTSESDTMARHMRFVAEVCRERFALAADSLVVEIGSNTGTQLKVFQEHGMRTVGVDPARNLAMVANAAGIETVPEFFTPATAAGIRARCGPARLVLGRHVFAHIDHLAGVAAGVRALLGPEGVFAVEVPHALELLRRREFDTIYHEHLSYFFVSTLVTLFEQHGLRVIDIERLSVHGGSLLVFVGRGDGVWPVRPILHELLAEEERSGIHGDEIYRGFADDVDRLSDELVTLVRRLVADGKRLAGYGAPAKGNTLLNVCRLGPRELEFCCDTTELKQGKVLPGTHIPVHSPDYAKTQAIDYYLLLAWNYSEEILRKETDFVAAGGRFILPVPRPTIVPPEPR
jgi:novobiocin biosynthesis protein NovU/D-mycarose 3-C-methyltransferase